MSTCNRLDLQTLGSQPIMPKNLPDHCNRVCTFEGCPEKLKLSFTYVCARACACVSYQIHSFECKHVLFCMITLL
jgi:hypothetical protein